MAYDKPSEKLFGFLKKHYGLSSYIPQNNNYVIFDKYWAPTAKKKEVFPEEKLLPETE